MAQQFYGGRAKPALRKNYVSTGKHSQYEMADDDLEDARFEGAGIACPLDSDMC
jgi:hypothetical protein